MKKTKKWRVVAPLALGALGALAAGAAVLLQKPPKAESESEAPAPAPAMLRTGVYSFISGFQDAATVELSLDYDPERCDFAVVEDGFLNYSDNSHVAIVYGGAFNLQLEYAAYGRGEDFAAHSHALREKYSQGREIVCGALAGVWVLDGDSVAMHFPIPGDAYSYLLITAQKTPDYEEDVTSLPDYAPLRELLSTVRFARI